MLFLLVVAIITIVGLSMLFVFDHFQLRKVLASLFPFALIRLTFWRKKSVNFLIDLKGIRHKNVFVQWKDIVQMQQVFVIGHNGPGYHLLKIYTKRDIIEINVDKFLKTKEEIENHVKRFQDLHRNLNL